MEWVSFDIPETLLGETHISESAYVTTYRTEVLLPKDSQYPGYCFLHPSKLIKARAGGFAAIMYNSDFTFTLIKKDREPGKKYKRYRLTVPEILAVYAAETQKVKGKQEKKEKRRLAQIGTVVVVDMPDAVTFLFQIGKQYYYSHGGPWGTDKHIEKLGGKRKVIAENIPRGAFEAAYESLKGLREDYWIVHQIRNTILHNPAYAMGQVLPVGESFEELCDKWEVEFYITAAEIIEQADREKSNTQ